jgi:hypothetical protein
MKRLILAFAFLTIMLPPLVALARAGSYRSAIDRKWNEVQAWQKMQDALFKAIELEAAKGGVTLRPDVEEAVPINVACPTCVHYRAAP